MRHYALALAFGLFVGVNSAAALEVVDKSFPMAKAGTLHLKVPSDWKDTSIVAPAGGEVASVLDFSTRDDSGPLRLQIVSFPPAKITPELAGDDGLRKICEVTAKSFVAGSVEKKLTLIDFEGDEAHGFTYELTRATEGPYKCITGGAIKLGEIVLIVSTYHQQKQPAREAVMEMLRTASLGGAAAATTQPAEAVTLFSSDESWSIRIPKLLMSPSAIYRRVNGDVCQFGGSDGKAGLNFSAVFEPAEKKGGASIARNFYYNKIKQARVPVEKVKLEGNDQKSILRYQMSGSQFVSVYLVNKKTWASIHFTCDLDNADALKLIDESTSSIVIKSN